MADIAKLITLTEKGASTGPNYEVYYSLDCVNYTASVPFVIALPNIGSTGSVVVPFETRCIKLKNTNDDCSNSVTHSTFPIPTTTTTMGPTTTTTTLASGSTTTTTLSANCVCYEIVITSDGGGEGYSGGITYLPCDGGSNMERNFLNPGTYYQCARVIGGLGQIEITFGTGTITPVGSCNSGACPPATTTSTTSTTTTTTTTAAPTTTTTTLSQCVNYCIINDSISPEIYWEATDCFGNPVNGVAYFVLNTCTWTGCVQRGSLVITSGAYTLSLVDCPNPTTTTTTLAPGYYYYAIDKFNCFPCSLNQTSLIGRSSTLKTNGNYYNIGDGYVYRVNYSTGDTSYDVDLDGAASAGTNCGATCSI